MLSNDTKATTFPITNRKHDVPVVTLSTQDIAKLFEKLKSGFKETIDRNKLESKLSAEAPNPYLDFFN